jgi:hypothetical protein
MTLAEARSRSTFLYNAALDAEAAQDFPKAVAHYEEMVATLPREAWYGDVKLRLEDVRKRVPR